ncbi:hypothetical protein JL100_030730 (plasmid) [Skermanella mucosa]|uniref:hypothetical protein n=1 Tax=Skermanella mucosa TaxID=1789672 RepID=UPI00192BC19D|nr:hypothetical protein [Skermanella mucosa]UEM24591.1 hypothetical protein JL100_030730 [Skermanella mucosa]
MLFSASFTSINGNTEGAIEWRGIDTISSTLTVAGVDIPITEDPGIVTFELEGKTLIDFATGELPLFTDPPYADPPYADPAEESLPPADPQEFSPFAFQVPLISLDFLF